MTPIAATMPTRRRTRWSNGSVGLAAVVVVLALLLATIAPRAWRSFEQRPAARQVAAVAGSPADLPKPSPAMLEPQSFKPLTALDAVAENAGRPLDNRRMEVAFPFLLSLGTSNSDAWDRAVQCLALANYYEAAGEGDAGMRAVSQVVLNRMRHPAFPHSVCEVVFQGAARPTGCQFTFTCDGSLVRVPAPALFARARAIAVEALRGRVEASVGMATHYHANTVVPYWADELDKVRTLGNHIFYLWRGSWGNRAAFRSAYSGERTDLALPFIAATSLMQSGGDEASTAPLASGAGWINLSTKEPAGSSRNRTFLAADEPSGSLKLDEDANAGTLRPQPLLSRPGEKVLIDEH